MPETTANQAPRISLGQTCKLLIGYAGSNWYLFVTAVAGFCLLATADIYFATVLGVLVDTWDNATSDSTIPFVLVGSALLHGMGGVIGDASIAKIATIVAYKARHALFEKVLYQVKREQTSPAEITTGMTSVISRLRESCESILARIFGDGIKFIILLIAAVYLSWQLTVLFVVAILLVTTIEHYVRVQAQHTNPHNTNPLAQMSKLVREAIDGFDIVQIFAGQKSKQKRFEALNQIDLQCNKSWANRRLVQHHLNRTAVFLIICLLVLGLYFDTFGASMTRGSAVSFVVLAALMVKPIRRLYELRSRSQALLSTANWVLVQLSLPVAHNDGKKKLGKVRGELSFDNVGVVDNQGLQLLRNINLTIEPGQTVALVGLSNSGKTALINLVAGFCEIAQGRVLLDGEDIHNYTANSLRHQIALVSQQDIVFSDSLRNNIAYGSLSQVSDDDLQDALRKSHASQFVFDLPNGIDTWVGEGGAILSARQQLQIAIARAMLKDAPIVLLDEPIVAPELDEEIADAVATLVRGKTAIVVTRQLAIVEAADQIVVMDDEQIIESGSHDHLMEKQNFYAQLHSIAFQDQAADGNVNLSQNQTRPNRSLMPNNLAFEKSALGLGKVWYTGAWWLHLFRPLTWLYNSVRKRQVKAYTNGTKTPLRTNLPVIVVGNITVGGTGKTPLVGWLVDELRRRGFTPGVVMRGYGGKLSKTGTLVPSGADPERYSDEAVQLRDHLGCAVTISAKRIKGLRLLEAEGCDIAVSDDGLQHYAMARDLEIAVIDGTRGIGNGLLLPAGPLREPISRLNSVDWVIANGKASGLTDSETIMIMQPTAFVNVATEQEMPCAKFVVEHPTVHALCGIGNPERFYTTLQQLGLISNKHTFSDHYDYREKDLIPPGGNPVVCTEKDAAKLKHLEAELGHVWFLRVAVELPKMATEKLSMLLAERAITPRLSSVEQGDPNFATVSAEQPNEPS